MKKSVLVLSWVVASGVAWGFGQKKPEIAAADPAFSQAKKVTALSIRFGISDKKKGGHGLKKEGSVSFTLSEGKQFDESSAAVTKMAFSCVLPVAFEVEASDPKSFDEAFNRGVSLLFKKLPHLKDPKSYRELTSGFFVVKDGKKVEELKAGTIDMLEGAYEFVRIPGLLEQPPTLEVAAVNEKGVGFILALREVPKGVAKVIVKIDRGDGKLPGDCGAILEHGFRL